MTVVSLNRPEAAESSSSVSWKRMSAEVQSAKRALVGSNLVSCSWGGDEVEEGLGFRAFEIEGAVAAVAKGAEEAFRRVAEWAGGEGGERGGDGGAEIGHGRGEERRGRSDQ